jgi:transcriptional regulator with XRE-family HTH domain
MKLGELMRKERERRGFSLEEVATHLGMTPEEYRGLEWGGSPAERWGPLLARIAIRLEVPTSRLIAGSGRSDDARRGAAGGLIRGHRERRGLTAQEVGEAIECPLDEYLEIEAGSSPIEVYGPLVLRFAEFIQHPVFNLFYPHGIPLDRLDENDA